MKRMIMVYLSMLLALTLTACGGTGQASREEPIASETSQSAPEDNAEHDATDPSQSAPSLEEPSQKEVEGEPAASETSQPVPGDNAEHDAAGPSQSEPSLEELPPKEMEQVETDGNAVKKIRFLVDDQEIVVALEDHPAADALYERLPMELSFDDYNGTEKISYPDEGLPTEGAPTHCDPDVGSFCYYIPWGNFCFFYRDFRASESLMPLGEVESGLEFLESLDTAATVTVEAVD